MVHIMQWASDPNIKYSLSEIIKAVHANFNKHQLPMKQAVTFGLATKYGVKPEAMLKNPDIVTLLGDDPSFVRLEKDYDGMAKSNHKHYGQLNTKLGIIHNTLNCNKWANSKSKTI